MAGKLKYLEVSVTSDAKSLAGYTVLGDVAGVVGGQRTLILKRPDGPAPKPRKSKVNAKPTPADRAMAGMSRGKATDFTPPNVPLT
jgi:hypothetical protein